MMEWIVWRGGSMYTQARLFVNYNAGKSIQLHSNDIKNNKTGKVCFCISCRFNSYVLNE